MIKANSQGCPREFLNRLCDSNRAGIEARVAILVAHPDDEVIEMEVPTHFEGESTGVKIGGGKLQVTLHTLILKGRPDDMPKHVTIDVSDLELGQTLHIREIDLGSLAGKVVILGEADAPVVAIIAPRKEAEAAAAAGDAWGQGAADTGAAAKRAGSPPRTGGQA